MYRLTHDSISTYKGSVLPLQLLDGEEYTLTPVKWSTSDKKIVQITSFAESSKKVILTPKCKEARCFPR